ncbi:MAG: hypothetical protein IKP71_06590 [Candidatus Riflebacteria bacterium]|nr:hypothetical protein [Candidatus Riflebacteria bacterium]
MKNAILLYETQRDIVSASSCRLFGVPGFLSSILFLLLNPAAVIVVCWLYSLGQVLPVGSSGPITCGIHIRLLLGMKKARIFLAVTIAKNLLWLREGAGVIFSTFGGYLSRFSFLQLTKNLKNRPTVASKIHQ